MGYRWYDAKGIAPLFPFGYGLSCTTFSFSSLALSSASGSPSSPVTVTVTANVTNTGSRAGTEVTQLYLTGPAAAGEPPLQLKGFQKVSLAAGQTQQVSFAVPASAFQIWTDSSSSWITDPGAYKISVGDSSASLPLSATYTISGSGDGGGGASVTARIASPLTQSSTSGEIQFRLDSLTAAPFATVPVTDTGGWQSWVTTPAVTASPAPAGTHTPYVTFTSAQGGNFVNVSKFMLSGG